VTVIVHLVFISLGRDVFNSNLAVEQDFTFVVFGREAHVFRVKSVGTPTEGFEVGIVAGVFIGSIRCGGISFRNPRIQLFILLILRVVIRRFLPNRIRLFQNTVYIGRSRQSQIHDRKTIGILILRTFTTYV